MSGGQGGATAGAEEAVLEANVALGNPPQGDCLYVPRGYVHGAPREK